MAVDPLGLVYSGADGTGAAFKAPWTSYDPYQAEVSAGANRIKIMEEKRKLDEKAKAEALELASFKPSNWATASQEAITNMYGPQRDAITKAFSLGDMAGVQRLSAEIGDVNKAYTAAQNKHYAALQQAQARVNNTPTAYRDEANRNFNVFTDPRLATREEYPEVVEILETEKARLSKAYQGKEYATPEFVEALAISNTQDKIGHLLEVPRELKTSEWYPQLLARAKYQTEVEAKRVSGGVDMVKELTLETAKDITSKYWTENFALQRDMRRRFDALSEEDKARFGDVKTYFVEMNAPELVKADRIERGKTTFNFYNTEKAKLVQLSLNGEDVVGRDPFGTDQGDETTFTDIAFGLGSQAVFSAGQLSELKDLRVARYVSAGMDPQGRAGVATVKPSTQPISFKPAYFKYVPTAARDIELPDGTIIKKGSLITGFTENLVKESGKSVSDADIKWSPFFEGVKSTASGGKGTTETIYVPADEIKEAIKSQLLAAGKIERWIEPSQPTQNVIDVLGLKRSANKPASSTTYDPTKF